MTGRQELHVLVILGIYNGDKEIKDCYHDFSLYSFGEFSLMELAKFLGRSRLVIQ